LRQADSGRFKAREFCGEYGFKKHFEGLFAKAEGRQLTQEFCEAIPLHAGDHWSRMLAKPGL
jgi:hypothetical protein